MKKKGIRNTILSLYQTNKSIEDIQYVIHIITAVYDFPSM